MGTPKRDLTPLLLPGFTDVDVDRLAERFAAPFRDPDRRLSLINGFGALVMALKSYNIEFELWLDGSFVTCNPAPNDIDIVVLASAEALNSLSRDERAAFRALFADSTATKARYGCHIFSVGRDDDRLCSDWASFFGRARDGRPKGLARCRI